MANRDSHLRTVRSPLTREMLAPLESDCQWLQFNSALQDVEYAAVSLLLENRSDVILRVYGDYSRTFTDLAFLRFFPHIKKFAFDLYDLRNWDGLQFLPDDLEYLAIGQTRSKALSLSFLSRFKGLKELNLEGHTKGIEAVSHLPRLEDAVLRSIILPDLSLFVGLKNLKILDIKLGGTRNLDLLPELKQVHYLELWMVKGLDDLSPISSMHSLRRLHLESLKRVKALPTMSQLPMLKSVLIQNMKGISDLSPLCEASALENLIVWDSRHFKPEHFECLVGHPTLQRISLGLGSDRKNQQVEAMLGLVSDTKLDRFRRF